MANPSPPLKSILVAVPTTGGVMKSKTAETLFGVSRQLARSDIQADMLNIDNSDVVTVRNGYANMVLKSPRWDGLLFIDSDMEFDPALITRMIQLNVGVSAVACSTREIDLQRFHEAMATHGDVALARAESARFNVLKTFDMTKPTLVKRANGFYTMAAVGMAVCLIRRSALQAMVRVGAVDKKVYVQDRVASESWGFFDHHKIGDIALLEDFSFCYRWTEIMKRSLWVCADAVVKHHGDFAYGAAYQPILDREIRPRPAGAVEEADPPEALPG